MREVILDRLGVTESVGRAAVVEQRPNVSRKRGGETLVEIVRQVGVEPVSMRPVRPDAAPQERQTGTLQHSGRQEGRDSGAWP